jgi:hypothetical protein
LINQTNNWSIEFKIFSDSFETSIRLLVDESGFLYEKISWNDILLVRWSKEYKIIAFLTEFSPIIRFYEGSFLEGNHLTKIDFAIVWYNTINISIKDWTGVDIKKESQWLTSKLQNSIQYSIIQSLIQTWEYDLIFNDDWAGEIADIVWIKIDDTEQEILLELYHCKYSKDKNPWSRIEDLYTVCWQAQRSVRWTSLENTLKQIMERWIKHVWRYELWDMDVVNKLNRMLQLYKTSTIIYIVQPWVSKSRISDEQKKLLEVTENYLKNTFNISLKIIASQ